MEKLKTINPATSTVVTEHEMDTPQTIHDKFLRAKLAQRKWARVPLDDKITMIRKFRGLILARLEKLAITLTTEVGKPITQSRNELNGLIPRLDFFLDHVDRVSKDEPILRDSTQKLEEKISYEPLGVIGNISAWNYPWFVGSNVFIPALLTGNAVLYKPSEFAVLSGQAITELLYEAGIPKDVFQLVIGQGQAGQELLRHPLDGIFFTGSYKTGLKIYETASQQLMKVQLELGGKDPIYVCEDVDVVQTAAVVADGVFYNTGQSCCSVERVYVHGSIFDAFVDAFVSSVKNFVMGNPMNDNTYIGPLTRRDAHLRFLDSQVSDAKSKGARLLCGGKQAKLVGSFFEPTVFIGVNHSMELMREETFGPVIGVQRVENDSDAIVLMNDTEYGLTAGVYTQDRNRAISILSQLNTGTVYWNCCDRVSPRLPWSGRLHSGVGSTLSTVGIQTFLQPKAWHLKG